MGSRVTDKARLNTDERKLLIDTYKEVTGIRKRTGCGDCFVEIYLYFNKQKKMKTQDTEFEILPGKKVFHRSNVLIGKVNTADALSHLKDVPRAIAMYSKFPKDWKERSVNFNRLDAVRGKAKDEVKEPKTEEPKQDIKSIAIEAKKEALEAKTMKELKGIAESYPKEDWSKFTTKPQFIEYFLSK